MTHPAVALVAPVLGTGWPSGQILDLARGLVRAGARVLVLAEEGRIVHEFARLGIQVELARLPRRAIVDRRKARGLREPLRRLAEGGPLVVHGHGAQAAAPAALLARRSRADLALTLYDRADVLATPPLGRARLRAVFVHSAPAQEELVNHRGVPRELVRLVPAGIDRERTGDAAPREKWPVVPVIGALGRLEELGGHETLLRAASELAARPFQLLVVGEGPEKGRLLRLARELGIADRTVFAGDLPGRAEVFETIDIFVAPALRDGFGHDLLEAMARGLPVVATAAGAVFEHVADGKTGLLAPQRDEKALAAQIARLLDAPEEARAIGARAAESVKGEFPVERLVDEVLGALAATSLHA